MKKVIGLCLVVLLSSTSVFARENRRMDKRKMDPSARCEKMIADLKLDEKQAVEFRKLQKEYMEKAQKEREAMKAEREKQREKMLAMREDKNAQMKKILTEEQYKEYLSNLPVNESKEPVRAIVVDYTLEEELERGSVLAEDLINNLRKNEKTSKLF